MKKVIFLVIFISTAALLSLAPRNIKTGDSPLAIPPFASLAHGEDSPELCHMIGAPAAYRYRGVPFTVYGPEGQCVTSRDLFIGGAALNTLVAALLVVAGAAGARLMRKRSER